MAVVSRYTFWKKKLIRFTGFNIIFFYRGNKPNVIGFFGGGCHGTPLQVNDRLRSAVAMIGRAKIKKQHRHERLVATSQLSQ